jgi:hypothetical protein
MSKSKSKSKQLHSSQKSNFHWLLLRSYSFTKSCYAVMAAIRRLRSPLWLWKKKSWKPFFFVKSEKVMRVCQRFLTCMEWKSGESDKSGENIPHTHTFGQAIQQFKVRSNRTGNDVITLDKERLTSQSSRLEHISNTKDFLAKICWFSPNQKWKMFEMNNNALCV